MSRWWSRLVGRGDPMDPAVGAALGLGDGDRVLAWARDVATGAVIVASLHGLHHVPASVLSANDGGPAPQARAAAPTTVAAGGAARWSRRWLDVAAGAWEPHTATLTVTWADAGRPAMWTLSGDAVRLAAVLHDRVNASVLLASPVVMGERDLGRVALRKDLVTGALIEQTTLRRRSDADDPAVAAYVADLAADLREQAGL